jgi:hypothetical protein
VSYNRLPNRAELIERFFGIDVDGNLMVVSAYRFREQGTPSRFMYYIVRYREVNRRTERGSRRVWWLNAPTSREALEREVGPLRGAFAESRETGNRQLSWRYEMGRPRAWDGVDPGR